MKLHIQRSPGVSFCKRKVSPPKMTTQRAHKHGELVGTCKQCIKALAKHEEKTKREWH